MERPILLSLESASVSKCFAKNPMEENHRTLYKYSSIVGAIKIVKSGAVLLNSPDNFNDPFDSELDVDDSNLRKALELTKNYFLFKIFCDFVQRNDTPLTKSQKAFFCVIRKEIAACGNLIRKNKSYETMPFFNRALEKFDSLNEDVAKSIVIAERKFSDEIIPSIKDMRKKARISCFSKRNDSILMWSHYADSHRGVCIEFDETRSFFNDVKYSNAKCKLDLFAATSRILAYDFIGEKLGYGDAEFASNMLAPFYTKSSDWSYEEEVRCVLSDKEEKNNGYRHENGLTLLDMNIKRILVGSKARVDDLHELIRAAKNRGIPVVFMKEDPERYAIVEDHNRKYRLAYREPQKKNRVEELIDEIDRCLDKENYLGAFALSLVLPGIFGSLRFKDLTYKDAYIKWYEEMIGKYDRSPDEKRMRMPYLSGELCYYLKESFHNYGLINCSFKSDEFDVTKVVFKVEKKKYWELYCGSSKLGTNLDGSLKAELEINIRRFWIQLKSLSEVELEKNKAEIDGLKNNVIEDFDRQIDAMKESGALNSVIAALSKNQRK